MRLGQPLAQHIDLLLTLIPAQRARQSIRALRNNSGVDHAGPQRLDALARCAPYVIGLDPGTQTSSCGNRLQARHTGTNHDHQCRLHSPGGSGEHREQPRRQLRCQQRCFVTCDRCLRRDRIHGARARHPWHMIHGERGDVAFSQRSNHVQMLKGRCQADQKTTAWQLSYFVERGWRNLGNNVDPGNKRGEVINDLDL